MLLGSPEISNAFIVHLVDSALLLTFFTKNAIKRLKKYRKPPGAIKFQLITKRKII